MVKILRISHWCFDRMAQGFALMGRVCNQKSISLRYVWLKRQIEHKNSRTKRWLLFSYILCIKIFTSGGQKGCLRTQRSKKYSDDSYRICVDTHWGYGAVNSHWWEELPAFCCGGRSRIQISWLITPKGICFPEK